ncbi:unnamed protein product [Durusdinium trenchii]|uniref:Uncharacterized protein n=1 Tax=Durusdinium trenchii TaxID=1381693 RepID=A0ABP0J5Y4_9DINO
MLVRAPGFVYVASPQEGSAGSLCVGLVILRQQRFAQYPFCLVQRSLLPKACISTYASTNKNKKTSKHRTTTVPKLIPGPIANPTVSLFNHCKGLNAAPLKAKIGYIASQSIAMVLQKQALQGLSDNSGMSEVN